VTTNARLAMLPQDKTRELAMNTDIDEGNMKQLEGY
jgi:hypothetical protein